MNLTMKLAMARTGSIEICPEMPKIQKLIVGTVCLTMFKSLMGLRMGMGMRHIVDLTCQNPSPAQGTQ